MKKYFLFLIACAVVLATLGASNLQTVDWNEFPLDARSRALCNSVATLENNPAMLNSKKIGFSTPYVNVSVSNVSEFFSTDGDILVWADKLEKGVSPVYQTEIGASTRLKKIALDAKFSSNLYKEAKDNLSDGRDTTVTSYDYLALTGTFAHSINLSEDISLSFGVSSGVKFALRSNELSAGDYSDLFRNGTYFEWLATGRKYLTQVTVPVRFGVSATLPANVKFGATVYNNEAVATNPTLFSDADSFANSFSDEEYIVKQVTSIQFADKWEGDVSTSLTYEFGNKYHKIIVNASMVKLRQLMGLIITWPDHLKIGLEYVYNNIALRAGYQTTGLSFGFGLDFYAVHIDAAYGHVITTGNTNKTDQLTLSFRLGLDKS